MHVTARLSIRRSGDVSRKQRVLPPKLPPWAMMTPSAGPQPGPPRRDHHDPWWLATNESTGTAADRLLVLRPWSECWTGPSGKHTAARYGQHGLHSPRNEHIVMIRLPRHAKSVLIASVSLVTVLGLAQPAAAKGGDCGRSPPSRRSPLVHRLPRRRLSSTHDEDPETPPRKPCTNAGDAGCVGVQVANGTLRLAWVVPTPGWTYAVKSNGAGTNTRIQIDFSNTANRPEDPVPVRVRQDRRRLTRQGTSCSAQTGRTLAPAADVGGSLDDPSSPRDPPLRNLRHARAGPSRQARWPSGHHGHRRSSTRNSTGAHPPRPAPAPVTTTNSGHPDPASLRETSGKPCSAPPARGAAVPHP